MPANLRDPFSPCGRKWPREARSDEGWSAEGRRIHRADLPRLRQIPLIRPSGAPPGASHGSRPSSGPHKGRRERRRQRQIPQQFQHHHRLRYPHALQHPYPPVAVARETGAHRTVGRRTVDRRDCVCRRRRSSTGRECLNETTHGWPRSVGETAGEEGSGNKTFTSGSSGCNAGASPRREHTAHKTPDRRPRGRR